MNLDFRRITGIGLLALYCAVNNPLWAAPPADDAVVNGVVKFEGTVPQPSHVDMAGDPQCAKVHPAGAMAEDILADDNGRLQNVIVFISAGLGDRTFDPPKDAATIEQNGCMYRPHVIAIEANQKLEVVNSDTTTHTVHVLPANNPAWDKPQPPGSPIEVTFSQPEVAVPVKCDLHPWMRGYVAVFKHPYFAVTGKNGSFELKNLPPGTYTIQAWHEKLGTATQEITIGASETKTLEFVFKPKPGS
jgi:plastocyanin